MMDACSLQFPLAAISLCLAFVACLIPMFIGKRIRAILDPILYNEKYFLIDYENSIPFTKHRRALVYLAALGMKPIAQRRFPGVALENMVPPAYRAYGLLVFIGMFGGLGLAVVYGIIRFLICG
jgi:hypothetical protein